MVQEKRSDIRSGISLQQIGSWRIESLSLLVIGGLKKLTGDIDIYVVVFTQWI